MHSNKKYDLVAKIGEYEKDGVIKARWFTCGAVYENEKGHLNAKINGLPTGVTWNGWLCLFEPKNKQEISTTEEKQEDPDNLPF